MTVRMKDEPGALEQVVHDLAKFPEENPNPVLRASGDGAVLYANAAAQELAGLLRRQGKRLAPDLARAVSEFSYPIGTAANL